MCFSHINVHGHQKEHSDLRNTGSGAIHHFELFLKNDMGLGWFRSQNRLERRRPACTTLRLPQPMFKFHFRKFLTFWYKTFPAAAARETNQETKITVLCFGVIYINLMQIMNTKHKHTLLRKKSVIKLKLNLYFILFYFIKNNPASQFSKFRKYMVNSTFFPAAPQFHNSIRIELEAGQ